MFWGEGRKFLPSRLPKTNNAELSLVSSTHPISKSARDSPPQQPGKFAPLSSPVSRWRQKLSPNTLAVCLCFALFRSAWQGPALPPRCRLHTSRWHDSTDKQADRERRTQVHAEANTNSTVWGDSFASSPSAWSLMRELTPPPRHTSPSLTPERLQDWVGKRSQVTLGRSLPVSRCLCDLALFRVEQIKRNNKNKTCEISFLSKWTKNLVQTAISTFFNPKSLKTLNCRQTRGEIVWCCFTFVLNMKMI